MDGKKKSGMVGGGLEEEEEENELMVSWVEPPVNTNKVFMPFETPNSMSVSSLWVVYAELTHPALETPIHQHITTHPSTHNHPSINP